MKKILQAIDGRFGNKVLKPKYRVWWRIFTYGLSVVIFYKFLIIPFFYLLDVASDFLNYVIWGV